MLEFPSPETTSRIRQLERPQEVARLLEVGSNGEDLVDQILHAHDAVLSKVLLDKLVIGKRDALLINLAIAALVDELTDRFEVRVAVGDVGIDNGKHLRGSFGQADEDTVVDLEKTKELKDLARLGGDFVDTSK